MKYIYNEIYICNYTRMLVSNIEQVQAAIPHKGLTIRPTASCLKNYIS